MSKIIGKAADFYRLRVIRLDETDGVDFEWRDDILYREPPKQQVSEYESWALEAVSVDSDDQVWRIACYEANDAAHEALNGLTEDLEELTKSAFEQRYLSSLEP